jgi:serine protease Do
MGMKNHSWPQTIRIIIFSFLIGGTSAVLMTALTNNYLTDYAYQLNEITEPLRITQERPRVLPKSYEDSLTRVIERAVPSMGSVFSGRLWGDNGFALAQSNTPALALTSDGWVLTPNAVVGDLVHWKTQECEVDLVITDTQSGMDFAHCEIANLPVVDFANGYDLSPGDQVFVLSANEKIQFSTVTEVSWGTKTIRSSDVPARRIILSELSDAAIGSMVFNIYAELVGVVSDVDGNVSVTPFEHLAGIFEQVLESPEQITRPSLGVQSIDLSRTAGLTPERTRGYHGGALLSGTRAVERGSAAQVAGLLEGDIILSIEGTTINGTYSLDDVLTYYASGDEIRIGIDRAGEQQELSVTLGEN